MLAILEQAEKLLPTLLDPAAEHWWDSRLVTYEKPHVERLFIQWGEYRINCQRIWPCAPEDVFIHPHPWPAAMLVHGSYEMTVGYGEGIEAPPTAMRVILAPGTRYEMTDPNAWHGVRPRSGPALTLMVSGKPWGRRMPALPESPSERLTEEARSSLLADFRRLYGLG